MNGDGRKDLLIGRTNAKAQREGDGELIWLEHPAADALDGTEWTEHVITTGPDVWTSIDTMAAYPGELIVWSAQFFDETVSVHRVSLTDGTLKSSKVIDNNTIAMEGYKVMRGFKFHPVDLNGDGNKQVLYSNQEGDSSVNGVWVYEVPADIISGTYTKHTLATGFERAWKYWLSDIGAPGFTFVFYPDGNTSSRAHILVCGQGNERLWLLTPIGNASQFEY